MSEDRSRVAPEMTPFVEGPAEENAADDRRGIARPASIDEAPGPGEVPGPDARLEGRSRLGTTSGPDQIHEGEGRRRQDSAP